MLENASKTEKPSESKATRADEINKSENKSSAVPASSQALISLEKTKSIAFNHAEISEKDAKFVEAKLDCDDYVKNYEISFHYNNFEYDYEINAENGQIISTEKEYDSIYN